MAMCMQENKPRHLLSGQADAARLRLKLAGPGRGQVEQLWSDLDLSSRGGHSIREGGGDGQCWFWVALCNGCHGLLSVSHNAEKNMATFSHSGIFESPGDFEKAYVQ